MKVRLKDCKDGWPILHNGRTAEAVSPDTPLAAIVRVGSDFARYVDPDTEVTLLSNHAKTWAAACEAVYADFTRYMSNADIYDKSYARTLRETIDRIAATPQMPEGE